MVTAYFTGIEAGWVGVVEVEAVVLTAVVGSVTVVGSAR
jgi:hypothetical protein